MLKRITWLVSLTLAVGWLAIAPVAAQTAVNTSTLAGAVSVGTNRVSVNSTTNVTVNDLLVVDRESMLITAVDTTNAILTVIRGRDSTADAAHRDNTTFYNGSPEEFELTPSLEGLYPYGQCTPSNQQYAPRIYANGRIFDCLYQGTWAERAYYTTPNPYLNRPDITREEFDFGNSVMQEDGTAQGVADAEINNVSGSPLGNISYFEEQTKTSVAAASWVTINGVLDVSADNTTTNEGVEVVIGRMTDPAQSQFLEAGTNGACYSALVDVTLISGTDQVLVGFRQNETTDAAIDYTGYTRWNTVGINNVDGSIFSEQEVNEATDQDDSGVNWANGEERALMVCINIDGVPTAYFSAASPDAFAPIYTAITMTETGGTQTSGTGMVPFFSYLAEGSDGADVTVLWMQVERW